VETKPPVDVESLKRYTRPHGLPFRLQKIGHVVLNVADFERAVRFYTEVLGFKVSDVYPPEMYPGGMIFMRLNHDHHGVAVVGGKASGGTADRPNGDLNHFAFEVGTLDEVFLAREHLRTHGATIVFEGRRRAGCQIAVEFLDPDGNNLEIYWNVDQVGSDGFVRPPSEWKGANTLEQAVADPVRGQDTTLHRIGREG
jgi:catechol 2,3-dioxygenase-like lactoylglutathione lyase family enzyme